jgi:hypothetical protein
MKDYYIGESAPNSSYDNNMDDMSLNIILPKTIVKNRMKDSVDSTELGKPFESKKYTVTELAELYKPSVQRTVILSPTSSSVELDANNNNLPVNINSNTLSECITHDSMDDLRISSNKTYPVTNEPQSPTKFDKGLPASSLLTSKATKSPEKFGQTEVSTYVKIHWYNKLNFTFTPLNIINRTPKGHQVQCSSATLPENQLYQAPIKDGRPERDPKGVTTLVDTNVHRCIGPILDKYRKRKITPEN